MRLPIFKLSLVLALLVGSHLVRFATPATPKLIERVIVVIESEPYTLTDVQSYARTHMERELTSKDLSYVNEPDKIVLEQFITHLLVAAEVTRLGIKIEEQDIDNYINRVKRQSLITDEQLIEALNQQGMDFETYRESIRSELQKQELIKRQVERKVSITEEDVRRYYHANQQRFMSQPKIHLRHILLQIPERASSEEIKATFEKAENIRQQALQGEPFAELAQRYSQGAGASNGGDLGWLDRDHLIQEIADAAFDVPTGEVTGPVKTSLGFHLIKVEDRLRGEPIPLEEVDERIRKELFAKAMEERFQNWLKSDLRSQHRVDIKLPGFVFRAEKTKASTVDSLIASSSPQRDEEEKSLLARLNPLSYIVSTSPVRDERGEVIPDLRRVKLFGLPLFVTEQAGDADEDLQTQLGESDGTAEAE